MRWAALAALLAAGTAGDRVVPDPAAATTTARPDGGRDAHPRADPDSELLRDLELLEKLDLLRNLDLFDEGR